MDVRVWVGCLAHYNNGDLIGEWVDAADADDWVCPRANPDDVYINCEEYWVMDHEVPGVSGEMSPSDAGLWADVFSRVEEYEEDAFVAWLKLEGRDVRSINVDEFRGAYAGEHDSDEAFAQDMADEFVESETRGWPFNCIDWERAARELMMDYSESDGHYFRA